MNKIMIDYSFLEALVFEDHPSHQTADKMSKNINDDEYLYITSYTLNNLFNNIDNIHNEKTAILFENLSQSTRNITEISRKTEKEAFKLFQTYPSLTYEESLNITLMKLNDMRYILSFSSNYDKIDRIKRLYDVDKYISGSLNYRRYI